MTRSLKLILSPLARDDLRDTYRYGCLHWGEPHSRRYMDRLKQRFQQLLEHPELGVSRDDLLAEIRSLTVESHVIYYRRKAERIEIVRVLHGRQDPHLHL